MPAKNKSTAVKSSFIALTITLTVFLRVRVIHFNSFTQQLYGVAAVLGQMREQKSGHIINLSSVAGHVVFPGATVYCATKFAVKAISEGIRRESNGEIRSTNISPGAVATELTDHISHKDSKQMADDMYNDAIDADAIARAVTFAIEQPGDVDINEMIIRPTRQEL